MTDLEAGIDARRRLELDWEIMLCAPDDTTTSRCA
jgi:hypothetical protein